MSAKAFRVGQAVIHLPTGQRGYISEIREEGDGRMLVEVMRRSPAELLAALARHALETLSYHERTAVKAVFEALPDGEGRIVTSKIATQARFTRSLFTEALNRLETAGVLEARSLGMKGTYVRVTNPFFLDEVRRLMGRD